MSRRLIKAGLGTDAVAVIADHQPDFTTPGRPLHDHALWVLNDLARKDRHQALHFTVVAQDGFVTTFGQPLKRIGNVLFYDERFKGDSPVGFATPPSDLGEDGWVMTQSDGTNETVTPVHANNYLTFTIALDMEPSDPIVPVLGLLTKVAAECKALVNEFAGLAGIHAGSRYGSLRPSP
jgi:hypothetical protein